jgi:hypothetical protein
MNIIYFGSFHVENITNFLIFNNLYESKFVSYPRRNNYKDNKFYNRCIEIPKIIDIGKILTELRIKNEVFLPSKSKRVKEDEEQSITTNSKKIKNEPKSLEELFFNEIEEEEQEEEEDEQSVTTKSKKIKNEPKSLEELFFNEIEEGDE